MFLVIKVLTWIAIFFDNNKSRWNWGNAEYLKFLAVKLSGACMATYISLPSRINTRPAFIEFDEAVNKEMGITGHFTKGIGKDVKLLCKMEDNMHKEQADNLSRFKQDKKKLMENLPEEGEVGVITKEVSMIADIIGKLQPGNKVNNADDDCDSTDSDWSLFSCESEGEDLDEA